MIGVSFALWSMTIAETATTNVLTSGCLSVAYSDSGAMSLTNQFPVNDTTGKASKAYTFNVKNNCNNNVQFNVNLNIINTTTMPLEYIKYQYDTGTATKLSTAQAGTIYNNFGSGITVSSAKLIASNVTIAATQTSTHTLRFWIDENTPLNSSTQNKKFEARVSVVASPKA